MKVYGYVNKFKNEGEYFLENEKVDEIIYHDKEGFDFSFANKGDLVVIKDYLSISTNLKELLEFHQFVFETGINFVAIEERNTDTRKSGGKLMLDILAAINRLDDDCFRNSAESHALKGI